MDAIFQKELMETNFIHSPLPLHRERSMEAQGREKTVLAERPLWRKEGIEPAAAGRAALREGETFLRVTAPVTAEHWPEGAPADGDYCNYGSAILRFPLEREDWRGYNRLAFRVKPDVPGARVVHLNVCVKNDGAVKTPDRYFREGATVYDLNNHEWNDCGWEFSLMARDEVVELLFYVFLCGRDTPSGDEICYDFADIRLQRIENPEPEKGWLPGEGRLVLSSAGYWREGEKTALARAAEGAFSLLSAESGEAVFTAPARRIETEQGAFSLLDFSGFEKEGLYRLRFNGTESMPFPIGADFLEEALWKSVNFLYCERCGTPVPHRHGACHFDILAEHNGLKMSFAGGWHDAGDVSQQTLQTGEIVHALFETAENAAPGGPLCRRLLEEAQWGLEFVLRTRFGDGYRAMSAGATRWTNGLIGDMDDVAVRVHNHAFENFTFAAIEARAAHALRKEDPDLAWGCLRAAREDFAFAKERYASHGIEQAILFEHTYNSGPSQYFACICWAASELFRATGEAQYAEAARLYGEKLLRCQETGGAKLPLSGFFYRDEDHRRIVHFSHQSREQQFTQALVLLCETQPAHPGKPRWEAALRLYGDYLKALRAYTSPYGMLPAGVYRKDEPEDAETFRLLHLAVDYAEEKENYRKQLDAGIPLDENHVLRRFPVWFSFRGNTAIQLSMGKAASLLGRYWNDAELTGLAREQLYWLWGKNPFGQSLMYGMGSFYCSQYATLPGEAAGELPVGMQTYENEDVPYWPQSNNCTYKEVWTSTAGRFLWLAADLLLFSRKEK